MAYVKENISQLSYEEVKEIPENNSLLLLDVRELEEYVEGHIPTIPLVPMSEIVDLIDQFDKNEEYVLVCRSGRRSHEVAKFFKDNGIEKVHNYAGGMLEWEGPITTGEENVIKDMKQLYK